MYKYFLILHILLCILYVLISIKFKKSRDHTIYSFIIILFLPVIGFLLFLILYIIGLFKRPNTKLVNSYEEYIKSQVSSNLLKKVNVEDEINIVPMAEALVLNTSNVKRSLLLNLLKDDHREYINNLFKYLEDTDTETSHYAATAIAEIKSYYVKRLIDISFKYKDSPYDENVLIDYVNTMKEYLNSGLLDSRGVNEYKNKYSHLLEELLYLYKSDMKFFIDKINCELELKNYTIANIYCKKFFNEFKSSEEAYICYMKLFYEMKDYERLKRVIESMKKSNMKFSNKTLNIIRFWSWGEMDAI